MYIGITFAVVGNLGKTPPLIDLLKLITVAGIISSLTYFKILILKMSKADV